LIFIVELICSTLLPGALDREEANAGTREKREDDEYDYYGYDDVLVPPSSTG